MQFLKRILLIGLLLAPQLAFAAYSVPLSATTTSGTIFAYPTKTNGVDPAVMSPFFFGTSSATTTLKGPLFDLYTMAHFGSTTCGTGGLGIASGFLQGIEYCGNDNTDIGGVQIIAANSGSGAQSWGGFTINNDLADATLTHFTGLYYNSSHYTSTFFGGMYGIPNEAILQTTDGPLAIVASTGTPQGYISFVTGGTASSSERVRITNGGNFGIATTSPGTPLGVQGNVFIAGNITSTSTLKSIFPFASSTAFSTGSGAFQVMLSSDANGGRISNPGGILSLVTDGSHVIFLNTANTGNATLSTSLLSTDRAFVFPDSAGTLCTTATCGTSFAFPFTVNALNTFATTTLSTTTSIWTQGVFFASSTKAASQFPYASSTALTAGNLFATNISLGIGGLSVSSLVSCNGATQYCGGIAASTDGTVVQSTGGGSAFTVGALQLGTAAAVTGTLPIGNGGTAASSFTTSGNGVYYNGSALATAPLTTPVTYPYASSTALTAGNLVFTNATGTSVFSQSEYASTANFGATATTTITSYGYLGTGTSTPMFTWTLATGTVVLTSSRVFATSTAMTVHWSNCGLNGVCTQQNIRTGAAATAIGFDYASTSGMFLSVFYCNAGATAGALTWATNIIWTATPTQTTAANHCDLYSFRTDTATSSNIATSTVIFGSQTPFAL